MKKFRVKFSSEFCGFDTQFVIEAENEISIYDSQKYFDKMEEQIDYQLGYYDEEYDSLEDVERVFVQVEEITNEEYEKELKWN